MKTFFKAFPALLCLLSATFSAFAAEGDGKKSSGDFPSKIELTIADSVDYALEGNLSIRQGNKTLEQKKRQMDYVWGTLIPSIRASFSFSKAFTDSPRPATFSLGGSISLTLSPSIYTSVKSASLNYELQQLVYDASVRAVEMNVRKVYYSLLYEKENIALLQAAVDKAEAQYNSNLTKYNHGTLSSLDVLSSQNALQNAKISLDAAKGSYEVDIANFKLILGIPQSCEIVLVGSLDDIMNLGDVNVNQVEGHTASIANYEKQLEIAKNSLLATRFAAWGPSLNAGYSYSANGNTDTGLRSQNYGSISLSVSIPLDGYLPWSSGGQNIQNQITTIENLEMDIENAKATSAINIDGYRKQIKQCQDSISLRKKSVNLAEQAYGMMAQAYGRGTRDFMSLQNSLSQLQQAQLGLKSDVLKLASVILELENAMGLPFGTLTDTVAEQ